MAFERLLSVVVWAFALFAMFFGAGNIIYSLDIGQDYHWQSLVPTIGFILSGVCLPLIGIVGIFCAQGNVRHFFHAGLPPSLQKVLLMLILFVWSPLGISPRAVVLSAASLEPWWGVIPIALQHVLVVALIAYLSYDGSKLIKRIGGLLTPPLLITILVLTTMIFLQSSHEGLASVSSSVHDLHFSLFDGFVDGVKKGYFTLDGLSAVFFGRLLITSFQNEPHAKQRFFFSKVFILTGILLSLVYILLVYASAKGTLIYDDPIPNKYILLKLSKDYLGSYAHILTAVLTVLACLSTCVALSYIFSDYINRYLFNGQNKPLSFGINLGLTYIISLLDIKGIETIISPIGAVVYLMLLVLAVFQIVKHIKSKGWSWQIDEKSVARSIDE
ncbi:branched-chain amino acid transport system II carrier protein [Chlamydiia bacterium]|nr:branched-chain amino acid transport system II carrier protein [Chlamydiia bacterium]